MRRIGALCALVLGCSPAMDDGGGTVIEGGRAQFGRVAFLAQWHDGSLLLSEDDNGVIYRVHHTGP